VFVASKVWALFAASGIVLGAAYMLYLYQRTMFGKVENPKNEALLDLDHREFATFAPLLILAVWIGLYPAPFLRRLETSVQHIMSRVNPQYATASGAGTGQVGAPAAMPRRGQENPRRGISVSSRRGWGPGASEGKLEPVGNFGRTGATTAASTGGWSPGDSR
jgi:hypothetical protein